MGTPAGRRRSGFLKINCGYHLHAWDGGLSGGRTFPTLLISGIVMEQIFRRIRNYFLIGVAALCLGGYLYHQFL
jgi:hypothetical protein